MSMIDRMNAYDQDDRTSESISIRQTKSDIRKNSNDDIDSDILSKSKTKSSFGGQLLSDGDDSDNNIDVIYHSSKIKIIIIIISINNQFKILLLFIQTKIFYLTISIS